MTEQFLTKDRIATIARSRNRQASPFSNGVVSDEKRLDRDDYRSFVAERRVSAVQGGNKVLAKWLSGRKAALVEPA